MQMKYPKTKLSPGGGGGARERQRRVGRGHQLQAARRHEDCDVTRCSRDVTKRAE